MAMLQRKPGQPSLLEKAEKATMMQDKLAFAKRQIDVEVRQLLPEVEKTLKDIEEPAHREILYSLRIEMAELLNLPDKVNKEKFYAIVARLQGLQASKHTPSEKNLPHSIGLLISKILFSTSRCARLLQYMDAAEDQHDLNSTVRALNTTFTLHEHRRASLDDFLPLMHGLDSVPSTPKHLMYNSITVPSPSRRSVDSRMPRHNDTMCVPHLDPASKEQSPGLNAKMIPSSYSSEEEDLLLVRSKNSDDSWGRTSFDDGQALQHLLATLRTHPATKLLDDADVVECSTPPHDGNGPPLLCRICECMVNRDRFQEHTQICCDANHQEEQMILCNQKLAIEATRLQKIQDASQDEQLVQHYLLEVCRCVMDIEGSSVVDNPQLLAVHCSDLSQTLDEVATRIQEGTPAQMHLEQSYTGICNLLQEKRRALGSLQALRQSLEMTLPAPVNLPTPHSAPDNSPKGGKTGINDFKVVKPISHGAYGAVVLAKKKSTGDYFAMKKLKRSHMVRKKQVEHVMRERNILAATNNPFLVKMFYAFQSKDNLFVVMEFCQGGDLASMLENLGAFSEEMTKAYTTELVLGLIYLKEQKIVHRDLKPDNILISASGHIKVTDFGLSYGALVEHVVGEMDVIEERGRELSEAMQQEKETINTRKSEAGKRYSEVGTPHYLAPEILTGMGHSYPVDYWALGVMIYEFLYGCPPFDGPDLSTIFYKITSCEIEWHEDVLISAEMQDLIQKLLVVDPDQRLGSCSLATLQSHPVFAETKWETVLQSEAIFIPEPDDMEDVSYFNDKDDDEGVTGWSFDGLETGSLSDTFEDDLLSPDQLNSTFEADNFLGFSFKNLSQLKSMNFAEIKQLEIEEKVRSSLE